MNISKKGILSITLGICVFAIICCFGYVCKSYKLDIVQQAECTVIVENERELPGKKVELGYKESPGYRFVEYVVTTSKGELIKVEDGKFTMPEQDVCIRAKVEEIDYTITLIDSDYGEIILNQTTANYKDEITLDSYVIDWYLIDEYVVTTQSGKKVDVNLNSFVMPSENITIELTVFKVHVIHKGECENGSFITAPEVSIKGTYVTLFNTPNVGYELDHYIVKNSKGEEIEIYRGNSFVMPDEEVTVWAIFKLIED